MKISSLLVSQPKPTVDGNPYVALAEKLKLTVGFRQFIKVEGVTSKEFRAQHLNLPDFKAVVFTSKVGIDNYFKFAKEIKYKVPEDQLYYCSTKAVADYLQKYITYRKRKIFFGEKNVTELTEPIKRHVAENTLIVHSDVSSDVIPNFLDKLKVKHSSVVLYKTVSADLSDMKEDFKNYQVLVFFTPSGIKSLKENFPDWEQGDVKIAAFGKATQDEVTKLGYRLDIMAPTEECKSMTSALEQYIVANNKKK
ncbi:MAG: uroporphyrinogen-III synthase [Bacteroidales bacterium]|nr:uroporphyrinogen-III synthase [Bacteroidales bacterium]